jgi:hypothetical protein
MLVRAVLMIMIKSSAVHRHKIWILRSMLFYMRALSAGISQTTSQPEHCHTQHFTIHLHRLCNTQAVTGKDFVAAGEQGSKEKTKAKKAAATTGGGGAPTEPAKNKKAERIAARLAAEQAGKGAATKDVSAMCAS